MGNNKNQSNYNWSKYSVIVLSVLSGTLILSIFGGFFVNCFTDLSHKKEDAKWLQLRQELMTKSLYKYDYSDSTREFITLNHFPLHCAIDSLYFSDLTNKHIPRRTIYKKTIIPVDTIYEADSLLTIDDLQTILMMQQTILSRQDRLADDLRQETNNTINKMNGWLALWLGVMAIIGVFVPITLQFKLYKDSQDEAHKLEDILIQKETDLKDINEKYRKELKKSHEEFLGKMEEHNFARVVALTRNVQHLTQNQKAKDRGWRKDLLHSNLREITNLVDLYIKAYFDNNEFKVSSYKLSIVLLQLCDVLHVLTVEEKSRSRRLIILQDRILKIIGILNTPLPPQNEIEEGLNTISLELHNLISF